MHTIENLKGKDHIRNPAVDGRISLKEGLKKMFDGMNLNKLVQNKVLRYGFFVKKYEHSVSIM